MYDESQPEPVIEPETENETKIHGYDADANYHGEYRLDKSRKFKNHFDRLSKHNRGLNGKWFDQAKKREVENLAIFDIAASRVELTVYHHKVARQEFSRVPLSKWSSPNGIDTFLSAIMICAIILKKDPRFSREYNTDRKDESQDELFLELMQGLPYRKKDVRSCYQKALRHVRWEPVDWNEYINP